jgi:hypothetical protein
VPEGALLTHTVEAVLHDLAASGATGCLLVRDQEGDEAEVFLRDGEVYAVSVPGRRVMLGVRLMSRGALTPEALAEALEIQRTELQGWRLGELLVHLGYVELSVVEEFVVEHLKDALADLLGWPVAAWKFRKNKKTRQDVAPPTPVAALFDELRHRATTWETILAATGGPAAVPTLAAASPSDDVALGPNEWALLCKIDDTRSVADLAGECGFTLFEAGQVVMRLVEAGLVGVPGGAVAVAETAEAAEAEVAEAEVAEAEVAEVEVAEAEVAEVALEVDTEAEIELAEVELEVDPDDRGVELVLPVVELAELEAREAADREAADREAAEAADLELRRAAAENKRLHEAEILHRELEALAAKEAAARIERAEARKRARAEMREEQARAEADAQAAAVVEPDPGEARPDREASEAAAWADHAAWLTAARAAAEEPAWADHATWLAAARAAAEEPAWADHAAWLAGQAAAELAVAEDQAWVDHELWLSDRAAEEAARVEAELQAAREQAERELADEAARRSRDAAEAEVRQAAERIAREEAERQEHAEADRLAAEAAEQIAAAEAARIAAEQAAAEQAAAEQQAAARAAAEQQAAARAAAEQQAAARAAVPQPSPPRDDNAGASASHASSLLTQLNREAPARPPQPAPAPEPVAAAAEPEPEPEDAGPEPMVARDHADTAMLLRELSSLGFGADDESAPHLTAARPAQPVDPKKKRKGLFGRG